MKKWIFSARGFSLVELTVAVAMAGGLALVVSQLAQNTSKTKNHFESSMEITSHFATIAAAMQNKVNCGLNFEGQSSTAPSTYTELIQCKNLNPANQQCLNGPEDRRSLITVNQADGTGTFKVTNIQTIPKTGNVLNLVLTYEKVKDRAKNASHGSGVGTVKKSVVLHTVENGGVIRNCYSDVMTAIEAAIIQSCDGNNGQLAGTAGSTSDPLRCVHDSNNFFTYGSSCGVDEFVNGYLMGTGNKLIPQCSKITDKSVCGTGQYLVQAASGFVCRDVPVCSAGQKLNRNADGSFICGPISTCGANHAVFNSNGSTSCIACSTGQVLINTNSGWQCKSPNCLNSKNDTQQYFIGFDGDGDPICNDLIVGTVCSSGRMKVSSGGSVNYECCTPDCSGGWASDTCQGVPKPSRNGCGQCSGTKDLYSGCNGTTGVPATSECGLACPNSGGATPTWSIANSEWSESQQCAGKDGGYVDRVCMNSGNGPCDPLVASGSSGNTNTRIWCPKKAYFFANREITSGSYVYHSTSLPAKFISGTLRVWLISGGAGGGGGTSTQFGYSGVPGRRQTNVTLNASPGDICRFTLGAGGSGGFGSIGSAGVASSVDCGGVVVTTTTPNPYGVLGSGDNPQQPFPGTYEEEPSCNSLGWNGAAHPFVPNGGGFQVSNGKINGPSQPGNDAPATCGPYSSYGGGGAGGGNNSPGGKGRQGAGYMEYNYYEG